ncbi:hypothetical protein RhiirA5_427320 [Rhizophagus irregularis]|uniref:Uncharacterized protein n=1 Tax=Rhizophagus irregularis TaxID=588596 RepID=A0A2N0P2K5_9GLOM|nr:hypothetical protein RhiirA5_427320 [Rhizophagus irregularis]
MSKLYKDILFHVLQLIKLDVKQLFQYYESGNDLSQHFNFFENSYKKPLFNYFSFCKHLNLERIEETNIYFKEIRNDILNLKRGNDKFLLILKKVCKSIKELKLNIYGPDYNDGIVKLIENQKNLFNISFLDIDKSSYKIIENLLIKYVNIIQYISTCERFKSKVFMSFVNLKILELKGNNTNKKWYNIRNFIFTFFTNFKLTEISYYNSDNDANTAVYNGILIRAVYHNCPNIIYLELLYKNENILDLEKLLNNCQYLKR